MATTNSDTTTQGAAFDGSKLIALRTQRRLRQKDIARATGRTAAAVSQIETGDLLPSSDWVREIAACLLVAPPDLMTAAEVAP